MELKNVNPNGDNVVVRNVININLSFFENCEKLSSKTKIICYFSTRCHDYPKNKISHIIHLTNQH
jgi:hypothetical protein